MLCYLLSICSCPAVQAQGGLGLGGSNLFGNSGVGNAPPESLNNQPNPGNALNSLTNPNLPIGSDDQNKTEENWQPATFPPFPVRYLSLPGLDQTEKEILSQIYFVVINDAKTKSFTQLYKKNRLDNVSSFVTADSIIHPLFALQNNIRLKVIETSLIPSLESLLISMIRNNEIDYAGTEDAEIKEEIKYNWAFLTVAIKLLVPDFPLPNNPGIKQLVEKELNNIRAGKPGNSAIFHRFENYSIYSPVGFYKTVPAANRFYYCYQWLSQEYLELSDVTSNSANSNGNEFRRAVLLFQSLAKVKIEAVNNTQKTQSGFQIWKQINKRLEDLGINSANRNNVLNEFLLPDTFVRAMDSGNTSGISTSSLSNPLNRTRLLLTIRSCAPRQFNSMSIFSLDKKDGTKDKQLTFHLFNPLYEPAQEMLLPTPIYQREATSNFSLMPIALLLVQTNGVRWANRVMATNASKLDEQILDELKTRQNVLYGSGNTSLDPFWKLYAGFSNPYTEKGPLFGQTAEWRTFCLERQISGWVDNCLAAKLSETSENKQNTKIETSVPTPNAPVSNASAANTSAANNATSNTSAKDNPPITSPAAKESVNPPPSLSVTLKKFGIPSWRTTGSFNYLEPDVGLYSRLSESQLNLEKSLSQSGLFPSEYLAQSHDFVRLLKRLSDISKLEINMDSPKPEDQSLLANIDKLLAVIEPPLPGKIFVPFPISEPATSSLKSDHNSQLSLAGVNMEITYPATLYIIMQYKRFYYLLRGATYSYSEKCGDEINEKHWQRQVEFGFINPPFWCQSFHRNSPVSN